MNVILNLMFYRILLRIFIPFSIIFVFLCFVKLSFADGEFKTKYKVDYQIDQSGTAKVAQQIMLKNNTPNYYADKFELKIGSVKITNIKAFDELGPLETEVKSENNVTTISVNFNQRVIGQGKILNWTLTYESVDLAVKSGQIWEISIPKVANNSDIEDYQVKIATPVSFGKISFSVPEPISSMREGLNNVFIFEKEQLFQSGISMSFGEKQVFQFTLNYYLENNNLTSRKAQITLPPDNNYQKIVIEKIEPKPFDISSDYDGNFIGYYKLAPKQQINIIASGFVEVFSKPFRNIDNNFSEEDKKRYIQPQKYWETDSAVIKDKASQLNSPKKIYDFVVNYLSYNEDKLEKEQIPRLGALSVFNTPKDAVCMEFTDLFIALSRAAGIPAREVIGYAYSQNSRLRPLSLSAQGDLLHSWPQYWDDKLGWVQIDPTWASTSGGLDYFNKLDFNHVTLAQRGQSSTFPLPAGSFKKVAESNKKDVLISFAENLPQATFIPELALEIPDKIYAGIPMTVNVKLNNTGTTSIIGAEVNLESQNLNFQSLDNTNIAILPPLAQRKFRFKAQSKNFLNVAKDTVILSFADTQVSKPVVIVPFYFILFSVNFLISLAITAVIIILGLIIFYKMRNKKNTFLKSER